MTDEDTKFNVDNKDEEMEEQNSDVISAKMADDIYSVNDKRLEHMEGLPESSFFEEYNMVLKERVCGTKEHETQAEALLDAMLLERASATIAGRVKSLDICKDDFGWQDLAAFARMKFYDQEVRKKLVACDIFGGCDTCFSFATPMFSFVNKKLAYPDAEVIAEKKSTRTRHKDAISEQVEPEKMSFSETEELDAASKIFDVVINEYEKFNKKPINFFRLVLNPNSFAATVENIFYCSFLFRDCYLKLHIGENKEPYITPVEDEERDKAVAKATTAAATMFTITKPLWKELIELLQIDTAMIPPLQE